MREYTTKIGELHHKYLPEFNIIMMLIILGCGYAVDPEILEPWLVGLFGVSIAFAVWSRWKVGYGDAQ